jgi:hypothetical protein
VSDVFDPEVAADAARGIGSAGPLGFRVGARTFTYHVEAGSVRVDAGLVAEGTIVAISEAAWSDLIGQDRTFVNLYLAGELEFEQGDFSDLLDWDPVLKFLHAGIPIFDPGRADLGEVDLSRTFTLDDTDAEMRAFLITAGFLHVRGVFGRDEIATLNCEVDRLAAEARPGDDRSWWATDSDGQERLCRLVYVGLYSLMVGELEGDPRLARLGRLLDPELRMAPDRMEGTAALIKVPGPTTGLSNIPWHQDCGMGGALDLLSGGRGRDPADRVLSRDRQPVGRPRKPRSEPELRLGEEVAIGARRRRRHRAWRRHGTHPGSHARVPQTDGYRRSTDLVRHLLPSDPVGPHRSR